MRLQTEVAAVAEAAAARPVAIAAAPDAGTSRFAMRRDGAGPRVERPAVAPERVEAKSHEVARESVAVPAVVDEAPAGGDAVPWPDESAEAAFLSDAKERGEVIVPRKAEDEGAEETAAKVLPALDTMVARIPAPVLEALEDLFRAKFVTVKRVPKKALKH